MLQTKVVVFRSNSSSCLYNKVFKITAIDLRQVYTACTCTGIFYTYTQPVVCAHCIWAFLHFCMPKHTHTSGPYILARRLSCLLTFEPLR